MLTYYIYVNILILKTTSFHNEARLEDREFIQKKVYQKTKYGGLSKYVPRTNYAYHEVNKYILVTNKACV